MLDGNVHDQYPRSSYTMLTVSLDASRGSLAEQRRIRSQEIRSAIDHPYVYNEQILYIS